MTAPAFYRVCVWLPIAVPGMVAVLHHGLGWRSQSLAGQGGVQIALISLLYGGVPYALLALWATWWLGGRTEPEVRKLMFRAPFLMAAIYVPFAAIVWGVAGAPVEVFLAVGILGAIASIPLGFIYVVLVLILRWALRGRVREARLMPE